METIWRAERWKPDGRLGERLANLVDSIDIEIAYGSKSGAASSNVPNVNPGATVQPTSV